MKINRPVSRLAWLGAPGRAVGRAKYAILAVAATYWLSVLVGILMVNGGNKFALDSRDQLVGAAQQSSTAQAYGRNDNLRAAVLDFAGNLALGAAPKTISGFSIVLPFPLVAYQGWVGGIVSVDGKGHSRFDNPYATAYYLVTLVLQLTAYSLAVGAGVNAGIAMFRPGPFYQGRRLFGLFPQEAVLDVGRIYALAIPLFLAGSLWEYLSPWNL